jgi:hypothetical protein
LHNGLLLNVALDFHGLTADEYYLRGGLLLDGFVDEVSLVVQVKKFSGVRRLVAIAVIVVIVGLIVLLEMKRGARRLKIVLTVAVTWLVILHDGD